MNRARLITTAAMLSGLLGLAGPALAETAPCTLNGVEPLPVLEAAKAAWQQGFDAWAEASHELGLPFIGPTWEVARA